MYCKRVLVLEIALGLRICLHQVPGHRGVLGNELADSVASSVATTGLLREVRSLLRSVRSRFFRLSRNMWHSAWQRKGAGTFLYQWIPSVHNIPEWFPPHRSLVHLFTGHGHFVPYLFRFNLHANNLLRVWDAV